MCAPCCWTPQGSSASPPPRMPSSGSTPHRRPRLTTESSMRKQTWRTRWESPRIPSRQCSAPAFRTALCRCLLRPSCARCTPLRGASLCGSLSCGRVPSLRRWSSLVARPVCRLWDLGQQRCIHAYAVHTDSVWALAANSAFDRVYSGGRDGCVRLRLLLLLPLSESGGKGVGTDPRVSSTAAPCLDSLMSGRCNGCTPALCPNGWSGGHLCGALRWLRRRLW